MVKDILSNYQEWKVGNTTLPTNYELSLSRMKGQVKRLKKQPEILAEYDSIIKQQLEAGVIERVPELDTAEKVHYLPHQAVIRQDAKTTKVRVVYDASAKDSKSKMSLNDCLHVGPSLNPLLIDLLLRFRVSRVALVADIEKAFLNISVDKVDRDCLRFLWPDDPNDNKSYVSIYRFCRVVFGLNASPFLLNGTIRHHLSKFEKEDLVFVRKMLESFYVDDLVSGEDSSNDAYALYIKAKDRMAQGGFNLRKWMTNDAQLRDKISDVKRDCGGESNEETFAKTSLAVHGNSIGQKVLGLAWNFETDLLSFDLTLVSKKTNNAPSTKRTMLSLLACLYDPLGYYSPVTVSMKILFQQLCSAKLDWDNELSGEAKAKWENWIDDLKRAKEIIIPRCVYDKCEQHVVECFLHGFGDASKAAYCAVVYLVYRLRDGSRNVRMLASKSRVTPLKSLTIPRLELMSARILTQLMDSVGKALESRLNLKGRRFWLDSKTALCWIQNKGEWKQFVQHRVNEILRLTSKNEWGHCPGGENPADVGSRGTTATKLKEDKIWWEGPVWLSQDENSWPTLGQENHRTPESTEEEKRTVTALTVMGEPHIGNIVNISYSSSFEKLVRITAWVMRFVNNLKALKAKETKQIGGLTVEESFNAEKQLIISAQIELKKQPNFQQLVKSLGLESNNEILRCQGRLLNSDLDFEGKKPIIHPKDHHLTRLIVNNSHVNVHHGGVRATLAEVRTKFWVPKGRQYVKKLLNKCTTCKKFTGKPYKTPEAAALPQFRVRQAPPFDKVGVDFAGPLYVKKGKAMSKAYIALFSCCVTRAIHLELVEDLSAPTFKRCLRRFIAARGKPSLIVSDNAKTFRGVSKILKQLFDHPQVKSDLEIQRIEWKFNLERAPWWGGFFERMVRSVKECLRKVLGNARLTFDELRTVLAEVEATINCRPLTYQYDEPGVDVLTPSHLIYGRRIKGMPDDIVESDDYTGNNACEKRFRYLTMRLRHFWNRWRREYLANLREFHRPRGETYGVADVQVGDVVTVFEDDVKRNKWKLGVVEGLIEGKDDVVRGAKIRVITNGKPVHLSRPVQKLYPLEIRNEGESKVSIPVHEGKYQTVRRLPRRSAALDAAWKSKAMLDS